MSEALTPQQTCAACGCTDDNACIDLKGEGCYWVTDTLCSACRTFPFTRFNKGFRKPKTIHVKEADLSVGQEEILLGELLRNWENNTRANRNKFLQMLATKMQEDASANISKAIEDGEI